MGGTILKDSSALVNVTRICVDMVILAMLDSILLSLAFCIVLLYGFGFLTSIIKGIIKFGVENSSSPLHLLSQSLIMDRSPKMNRDPSIH